MSGAVNDAGILLLLPAVRSDQDDIKQLMFSRIFLQQTLIHSLQNLRKTKYRHLTTKARLQSSYCQGNQSVFF